MNRAKLKIGVTCYPTFGGSGVVATEIGMEMARRGHSVHFICADVPRRLDRFQDNVYFHAVEVRDYAVFISSQYALALASKMVEVSSYEQLDVLHVHYAVPHAASAYLARQVLGENAPKIITTLHGTDITLVGQERSYLPITRFSIVKSDGVTTPSRFLRQSTYDKLNVPTSFPIEVIPNFIDTELFRPRDQAQTSHTPEFVKAAKHNEKRLVHVSNFRAVKRVHDVVKVFSKIRAEMPAKLILIGDGPERSSVESLVHDLNLHPEVLFLGKLESFTEVLQNSQLFLLPSESEGFGLAALEAMSCGVPVIASKAGGIPEVVIHNETGLLSDVGDVDEMSRNAMKLLQDEELYQTFSNRARSLSVERFELAKIMDSYERYYYKIVGGTVA